MSSRPFSRYQLISAGDMSGNITSLATIAQYLTIISYQAIWTGTPVGTFAIQVSNNYSETAGGTVANAGTWETLPLDVVTAAAGSGDHGGFDIHNTGFYAIRLVYTAGSSTGVLNVYVEGKVT